MVFKILSNHQAEIWDFFSVNKIPHCINIKVQNIIIYRVNRVKHFAKIPVYVHSIILDFVSKPVCCHLVSLPE